MRWTVHGERSLYDSDWVALGLVDVEVPQGARFDHHVVRVPTPATGVVVHDAERGVLLIHRHRFITDSWGWEVPAGRVEVGETPEQAAVREVLEETGWEPGPLTHLSTYFPANGLSDHTFVVFSAAGAERVGDPTDPAESDRVEWVPVDQVRELLAGGQITNGLTLTGLLLWLARHPD